MMDTAELIKGAQALQNQIVAWRRDFHKNPELGFEEVRTSGIVADELERLGIAVRRNVATTGVIGDIDVPGATGRMLLRADMDALPVQEDSNEQYTSTVPGVSHLCGHDAHTAMLLGAARLLVANRKHLKASVRLMFQPSEEQPPGGAIRMVEERVLDGVDEAFGIHVFTAQQAGRWGLIPGGAMAAADAITITIRGRGGHAATPEVCIDPVVAAAMAIVNLQTIMSRRIRPHDCGVLSLCKISGGDAFNVIPEVVEILGTVRTHSQKTRERVKRLMKDILHGVEAATGVTIDLSYDAGYPSLVNDKAIIEKVRQRVVDLFGEESPECIDKKFGGEDFSYILEKVPGAMAFLGVGNVAKGISVAHHNPRFRIDEDVLWQGTALHAAMAMGHHADD
jgi:amidohydrolase